MLKNSSGLKYIRQVRPAKDPSLPADFELVTRSGETVPFTLAWDNIAQFAAWLGFAKGDVDALMEELCGWDHMTGAICDMDGGPEIDEDVLHGDHP